jgi:hypothetical protein
MTVDRYLKGVLTVIAGALVWIAIQLSSGTASAQSRPSREPAPPQESAVRDVAVVFPAPVNREGADYTAQDERSSRQAYVPVYCVNGR